MDVVPGTARIVQTATSDRNNITWKRTFADSWTAWQKQATQGDVDALRTETTASVKNLGDRVTTEVNSITSKVNEGHSNDVELIRNSNFEDGNKGNWTDDSTTIISGNTIPSELGQDGMKVLRSVRRDIYEDGILYSVKPNETFDVDYWVWPTGNYDSQLGLCFWDNAKKIIDWRGVTAKKGTGWTHYTGTIQAPAKAAFAKPWFQINKDGSESASAAWMAKPSIRRHDNFADQKISEVNTKLDVANGQIQGKVTATDVNNILNGKGYATQSWAQSQFRMKSDSIDLEVKKITDPINAKIDNLQVGGRNLLTNTDKDISVTSHTTDGYPAWANIDTGYSFEHGKTYTFSTEARNSTDKITEASIRVFEYSTNTQVGIYALPADGKRHSITFTVPNDSHDYHLLLYAGHAGIVPGVTVTTTYHHPKLELGNVATDWTPAPEDVNKKIDTQTLDSANIDQMKTQGHYFVHNLTGNPIPGWVYVDVTGNGNDRIKQDVYQDNGGRHKYRRWVGSWTEWVDDVNKDNILSQINISPEQIKIASNKILIDGDTKIQGVLDVKQVTLQGKNGNIDLSGDSGIKIGNNVGATLDLNSNGVDIAYKNEFKMDINSSHLALMQRNAATDQKEPVTIGIFKGGYTKGDNARAFLINYNPGSATDDQLHGADFMALGYTDPNNMGSSQSQIQLISRNFTSKKGVNYRKGVKFYDDITLQPYQKINIGDNDKEPDGKWTNDQLMIHRVNWKTSSQPDRYQPTIRLGWNPDTLASAGVTFLWDQLKPFGNRDISNLGDIWFNGMKFAFGYVHSNRMMGGADQPAFMRIDPGNGSIMSGIAFAAGSTWDLGSGTWNITGAMMNSRGA